MNIYLIMTSLRDLKTYYESYAIIIPSLRDLKQNIYNTRKITWSYSSVVFITKQQSFKNNNISSSSIIKM
jgi:hypothetical protein